MELKLDRRPLYIQVHDRLLDLIAAENLQPGDRLPSETELAEQMGISRATLREALRLLEEERVISRQQGVGTFVAADHHLESGLERLESVLALAARQGMETRAEDLSAQVVKADKALAVHLAVPLGAPLTCICRTILVAKKAVAYLEDFVPRQWLDLPDLSDTFDGSVLDLLRDRGHPEIYEALANITAVPAARSLAARLGVRPNTALLLIEETLFDPTGVPVGFSRNYFVPERFRFHVVRK